MMVYQQEIPPGSRSGRVKFQGGQVIMILDGQGYTSIDGVKHTWKKGDVLNLPLRADGIIVQHFNTDQRDRRNSSPSSRTGSKPSPSTAAAASSCWKRPRNTGRKRMDDIRHSHEVHATGGIPHVHASVDHLANEFGNSARLAIRLDAGADAEARPCRRCLRARRHRSRPQHHRAAGSAAAMPTSTAAWCGSTVSCARR